MKIRNLAIVAAAALLLTACSPADSSSSGDDGGDDTSTETRVLRVATTGDSKPYAYSEDGVFKGFDIELMDAVAAAEGVEVEYVAQDFAAILPAVNNGQFDLGAASIAVTDERKQTVDFSDPYLVGYIAVLATEAGGVTSADGLTGKRLGLVQGTIQENYAAENYPDTEIVRFPDNNAGFSALTGGTIDAQFLDLPVAQDYIESNPDAGLSVVAEIPTLDLPAAFAVAKGNDELLKLLNDGLLTVMKDGTWEEIYTKYFPDQPVPEQYTAEGVAG